ncbi:IPT/TIG domain-containing protein [Microbacterium sp. LRZ72]|uniref:IPT/TIG domain-containing protein n=1 Tax=Microbacterium sp. LRZ72 TaxID=2942481 RepID=UPI0029B33E0E|nr:IPT/TIG domain-containing protein [Microbacterium sp. LRZ72]MDX2377981.1 IPT/TIG domain-containing protein [Microbacterium sp. LRZ72]
MASAGGVAHAAEDDRAEGEGVFLTGGALDEIVALEGAYAAFPPDAEVDAPIDVSALGLIDLGLGVQLFGGNDVLELGAVGQYAQSDAAGAFGSSGLIGANGAIQAGSGDPAENTTLDLAPVLDDVGATGLLSDLSVELGALAAQAEATRSSDDVAITSDYQVASGLVTADSPVLTDLVTDLGTLLDVASADVNALADDGGPIDTTVAGLVDGLDGILEALLPGDLVTFDPAVVETQLDLDLGAAIDSVAASPFVSGPVTIDFSTGTVLIDLDQLYALNDLDENTVLFTDTTLNANVDAAISDILTNQLPDALDDAITEVLDTTTIEIDIAVGVNLDDEPVGTLAIAIEGTLGGLLGNPGTSEPTVSLDGTEVAGLDLGMALDPVTDYAVGEIAPDVGDVIDGALGLAALESAITTAATETVTAVDPLLAVINDVVEITVNVQENPGDFRDPAGLDAGSFTQRAVGIVIAPGLAGGAIALDLASATVRAVDLALPSDLAMEPTEGPVTGGTPVTITGTNLDDVTDIEFGDVPVDDFEINPDGSISTTSPPQDEPGLVDVTVTNTDGSNDSLEFDYYDVTQVDEIDPDSGSTEGGTTVTIIGTCFTDATDVLFDGVAGTDLTVVSDTELTVTTPAGTAGLVDVTIVNPTLCGDETVPDGYTYVEPGAPVLSDIDPDRGPETGGTTVTITGVNFTDTESVTFGGDDATEFEVISDTEIEAVTPANEPGLVDVIVTNDIGDSAGYDFEYFDVAEITDVDPDAGPEAGGTTVTILGDCFADATDVLFGGVPATSFEVISDTEIEAVTPAGTGVVDVTVEGAGDCGEATEPDGFEFVAPPVVTDLEPTQGPETGGTEVTITGDGFTGTTDVEFGGESAAEFTVVSDTEIEATTAAQAPGVVEVTVQHPGGDVDAGDFEFLDVPSVESLDPDEGPEDGGTVVTITGEGFTDATGVTFDGEAGTDFAVDSDTQITVTTPAHEPGAADVVVTSPDGDSEPGVFVYYALADIDEVEPDSGPTSGGTTVTIDGQCFADAEQVLFGDTPARSFEVFGDNRIWAESPAGVAGTVSITVVGAGTCGSATLDDAFTYEASGNGGGSLPVTGSEGDHGGLAVMGGLLLLIGTALAMVRRRTA